MNIKVVGAKIKSLREQRNMTQEQLAEAVNLSTNHISVIERGVKTPKLVRMKGLENSLALEFLYFTGFFVMNIGIVPKSYRKHISLLPCKI